MSARVHRVLPLKDDAHLARLVDGHELVLAAILDLARADDPARVISIAETAARCLTGSDATSFVIRDGDECHYVDAEASPTEIRLLEALADSTTVALRDLRRRQGLEARATALAAELAALTYAVSHDLRAPIRHLEGFTRILLQDVVDLDPDHRHAAERIQDAAVHLREMVNGMLTLSRIMQAEVHPQPVDLAQLGREVAQALANAPGPATGAGRAGVVEFVTPQDLQVTGDPRLLLTVLQDLLGNAWKFTSRIPHPRVELGVGPGPVYFVRDNGVGFDSAHIGRLFKAFQRLHSLEDFPGIGIGLASVKQIVDKHGGAVRATASPDAGATFFFTLPGPPSTQ